MKNHSWLSLFALLVAIAGLLIALIAYFKRRSCALCDDLESDMVEFYEDDECCEGDCHSCGSHPEAAAAPQAAAPAPAEEPAE